MRKQGLLLLIILINEIAWPVDSAYAADHGLKMGTVVINEIAWMGSPVQGVDPGQWWRYEWLELYNGSDARISLDGWKVELSKEDLEFVIPLWGTIGPESYFLVASSSKISGADINYQNLGGKFSNSGQSVALKDNSEKVVDAVEAKNSWPAGDNEGKYTMEKTPEGAWQTSVVQGGTPKAENSKPFSTEKDPARSFQKSSAEKMPLAIASLAAFLSAGVSLVLKRRSEQRRGA